MKEAQRERIQTAPNFYMCLSLHPDQTIRGYLAAYTATAHP